LLNFQTINYNNPLHTFYIIAAGLFIATLLVSAGLYGRITTETAAKAAVTSSSLVATREGGKEGRRRKRERGREKTARYFFQAKSVIYPFEDNANLQD
jgi:hypothetical protein